MYYGLINEKENENKALFAGDSCHPLTPSKESRSDDEDQLVKILQVMGSVKAKETAFIRNDITLEHLRKMTKIANGTRQEVLKDSLPGKNILRTKFCTIENLALVELLEGML